MDYRTKFSIIELLKNIFGGFFIGFLYIIFGVYYSSELNTDLVRISGSLATGTIAFIGLQQTLFLSKQQTRLHIKKRTLESFIDRVRKWKEQLNLDSVLKKMYDDAIKAWIRESIKIFDISKSFFYFYLITFFLFVMTPLISGSSNLKDISGNILNMGYMDLPVFVFYSGLSLLTVLLLIHMAFIRQIEKVSIPKKGSGNLWVRRINNTNFLQKDREINYDITGHDEIQILVSFSGNITNGFFDTKVEFSDNSYVFVPDRNTFLSDFIFTRDQFHRPKLGLMELPFETGIIQGKRCLDNTTSTLHFSLKSCKDNKKIGFFLKNIKIKRLIIGIFEDPIFLPSDRPRGTRIEAEPIRDRYQIDQIVVNLYYG